MISDTCSMCNKMIHRRGKSETLRIQYINTKEVRCASRLVILPCQTRGNSIMIKPMKYILSYRLAIGTWNVAGRLPKEDFEIHDWLCTKDPADIYIIG